MRWILLFLACASLASASHAGPNGSIEVFSVHPETGEVQIGVRRGSTSLLHGALRHIEFAIVAHLAGETEQDFAAAAFYLNGLEPLLADWYVRVMPAAEFITIGLACRPWLQAGQETRLYALTLPVAADGASCKTEEYVELARVELFALSTTETPREISDDWSLQIVASDPAWDATHDCPLIARCNYPDFSYVCVTGGRFVINPTEEARPSPVARGTWSTVKRLFRD